MSLSRFSILIAALALASPSTWAMTQAEQDIGALPEEQLQELVLQQADTLEALPQTMEAQGQPLSADQIESTHAMADSLRAEAGKPGFKSRLKSVLHVLGVGFHDVKVGVLAPFQVAGIAASGVLELGLSTVVMGAGFGVGLASGQDASGDRGINTSYNLIWAALDGAGTIGGGIAGAELWLVPVFQATAGTVIFPLWAAALPTAPCFKYFTDVTERNDGMSLNCKAHTWMFDHFLKKPFKLANHVGANATTWVVDKFTSIFRKKDKDVNPWAESDRLMAEEAKQKAKEEAAKKKQSQKGQKQQDQQQQQQQDQDKQQDTSRL